MPKILAVDWGWARYGLAVSDDLGLTAQGLGTFPRVNEAQVLEAIAAHVGSLGIDAIVVGLPKNMNGSDGRSAAAARALATALVGPVRLPQDQWDERHTNHAAERQLVGGGVRRRPPRGLVDQVAATLILQGFLDRQRSTRPREDS